MITKAEYINFIDKLKTSINNGNTYILTAQDTKWIEVVKSREVDSLMGTAYGFLLNKNTDFEAIYDVYEHNFDHTTLYIAPIKLTTLDVTNSLLKKIQVTNMGILRLDDYYDVIRNLYQMNMPDGIIDNPLKDSDIIQCTFHVSNLPTFREIKVD